MIMIKIGVKDQSGVVKMKTNFQEFSKAKATINSYARAYSCFQNSSYCWNTSRMEERAKWVKISTPKGNRRCQKKANDGNRWEQPSRNWKMKKNSSLQQSDLRKFMWWYQSKRMRKMVSFIIMYWYWLWHKMLIMKCNF